MDKMIARLLEAESNGFGLEYQDVIWWCDKLSRKQQDEVLRILDRH